MKQTNFLIGRGERLTHTVEVKSGFGSKAEAYTFDEAKSRLLPQIKVAAKTLDELPDEACPYDLAVSRFILNPSYIAKSSHPSALLRSVGLTAIGSRATSITPKKWTRKTKPTETSTTELFVAGERGLFHQLDKLIERVDINSRAAADFTHIEVIAAFTDVDRFRPYTSKDERFFEVAVHLLPGDNCATIQQPFEEYAKKLGLKVYGDLGFVVRNMWFVPVEGTYDKAKELSRFAFVRVIRPAPKLRGLRPLQRSNSVRVDCNLPELQPLSSEPKVAILDGGLPSDHVVSPWLDSYQKLDPEAHDDEIGNEHGLAVTSAFLFGPIDPNGTVPRPFAPVNHLRILDKESNHEDALEMFRTLIFIEQVLLSRQYEFINLSLGPELPIEDTDVHTWTAVIDDLLEDGETFMTVAAGNNGDNEYERRIQVPADCVNAVAVGAANSTGTDWERASYSAIGPGRSPGIVKPDIVAFGGSASSYFHVLSPGNESLLSPQLGTSFAAPFVLRNAVGIRAILGNDLPALAIKALLVHSADRVANHDQIDVGWGKMAEDIMEIITCSPGVARVVYRGELKAGKYLRAPIPLPNYNLEGMVKLTATFCYSSSVDPQDSCSYTKAGLGVTFRPHERKVEEGKKHAKSKSFFQLRKYATEHEMRSGSGKWETVMHDELRMRGSSLSNPVFDIHYNARDAGGTAKGADKVSYALVVTIETPKHQDIFNDILRNHSSVLTPIQPVVTLPIRV